MAPAQRRRRRARPPGLVACLVDHVAELRALNRQLCRQLHQAKGELETLKRQISLWRGDPSTGAGLGAPGYPPASPSASSAMYAPGMLTDLVREIRDASKVREDALFNKVHSLIDEKIYNKINCNISQEKIPEWRNIDQLRNQLQTTLIDKVRTNDRLAKLEDELQNLRLNQSRDSHSPCSFSGTAFGGTGSPSVDQERIRLQMELNKERLAHSAAEARIHKLELMVTQMRAKKTSGNTSASYTPVSTPVHANGGAQTDSRQVVFGPITDL